MKQGVVWQFETAKLRVELHIIRDRSYVYDGDDENGETQAALDSGEFVAFDSFVKVVLRENDTVIAYDHLGGSVYAESAVSDFWTAHRDSMPMNRNCSAMRERQGQNVVICHYFPGMVLQALHEAREVLPRVR